MPTLAERLRRALQPRYELGPEVGAGGMALVFRADDTALARPVAVKVLRPELTTAVGAERFLREARALASVAHPNVVAVHECGEVDGILYYVMDFQEAETLRTRLGRGPLSAPDAYRLGIDLLAALTASHAKGVIHRDVKPANIFLLPDRAVLADFGIAKDVTRAAEPLTEAESPGTPAYMAPEQAVEGDATERSDLYSAGMVLYEAFTGRRWPAFLSPERGDWTGVPRRARAVLSRALDPDPARRWPSAATFRAALRRARRRRPTGLRVAVVGLGLLAMVLVWRSWPKSPPPATVELAVLPCESLGVDSVAAFRAWRAAAVQLQDLPDLDVLSDRQTVNTWENHAEGRPTDDWEAWRTDLRARWVGVCRISEVGEETRVSVWLHADRGSVGPAHRSLPRDAGARTGQELFHAYLAALREARLTKVSADEVGVLARYSPPAVLLFLEGKESFRLDALRDATNQFSEALRLEPDFALAEWQLAEAQRWLAHMAVGVNLDDLYRSRSDQLPARDSMLLAARVAPYRAKPDLLREVAERFPVEAYPTLLYADELYHRGGLWGQPIDSAVALLQLAVRKDSSLAPAVEHLAQAQIRLGRPQEAGATLERLAKVSGSPGQLDVYYPAIWGQAYLERFASPEEAAAGFAALMERFGPAGSPDRRQGEIGLLGLGARWIRYVELPVTQERIGRLLLAHARELRSPGDAATGYLAVALGALGQGRPVPALAALDSIAALAGTPEARLQAAEWRAIPYALDLDGFVLREAEAGAGELGVLWGDPGLTSAQRRRVALALALANGKADRPIEASAWTDSLRAVEARARPGPAGTQSRLLEGLTLARGGDPHAALERTRQLVEYDSVALGELPFARALAYWLRADWQAAAGDTIEALRSLYWHENTDLEEGTPAGIAQAAEVDAAFGVHARARTVELAARLEGSGPVAGLPRCDLVRSRAREVLRLWRAPDPGLVPARDEAAATLERIEAECAP